MITINIYIYIYILVCVPKKIKRLFITRLLHFDVSESFWWLLEMEVCFYLIWDGYKIPFYGSINQSSKFIASGDLAVSHGTWPCKS